MKRLFFTICLLLSALALQAQEPDSTLAASPSPEEEPAATVGGTTTEAVVSDYALWDLANTAYLRSDFRTAIRTYREILERGAASEKLYYNLANACFKDNRLGEAILYYRRALRLAPGDEDIRYNLSVAESRTKDRIESIPEFFLSSWMHALRTSMSGTAWTILSLAALVLTFAGILFYLLSQQLRLRKAGFYSTLCFLVLFIASTLFAAGTRREALERSEAIVMSSSAAVKSSPDKSATDLFVLHEGTAVTLGESMGDWREITLSDGKKGWMESRHVEAI